MSLPHINENPEALATTLDSRQPEFARDLKRLVQQPTGEGPITAFTTADQ